MAQIIVNNNSYVGRSISMSHGKIIIDGVDITPDSKEINIKIDGDVESVECDYCKSFEITGNVGKVKTSSGDVTINGNVAGGVQASSGDIECEDITGDVQTSSGDIKCKNVTGKVKSMSGDIKYVKPKDDV